MASVISIPANVTVQMYAHYHTDFVVAPWHSFFAFVMITWLCVAFVIFCNRLIPHLQYVGMALIICGGLTTIIVVAVMPSEHASNSFVWRDFQNTTGWSDGVCFLIGVLNGAFAIGKFLETIFDNHERLMADNPQCTPDAISHMAEGMSIYH
jgi:choline transport protein